MRFLASATVTLAILFSMYIEAAPTAEIVHIQGSTVNPQTRRIVSLAIDCASYGEFEPFTGSCETTNCGARGRNCEAEGFSGCIGFPNVQCPLKGCSCTNF